MGFNKKEKAAFLKIVDDCATIMPREMIKHKQLVLFNDDKPLYQRLYFPLLYPEMKENPKGDPMPKQSFRHYPQRNRNGDVITYRNPKTGKLDVIIKGYQEAKITNTHAMLVEQIKRILLKDYKGFRPFFKDVHIIRAEFIFKSLDSFKKADKDAISSGNYILFKETEPDLDNLEKLLWDAMQEAGVWSNDARICSKNGILKRFGTVPGVIVEIEGRI